jgi:hypothetical protein
MMGTLNEKYEKLKVKEAVKKKNKEKVRDGEKGKGWGWEHSTLLFTSLRLVPTTSTHHKF